MRTQSVSRYLFMVLLLVLVGCSGSVGDLEGSVMYQNKVLTSGSVTVVGNDGGIHAGAIGQDGAYRVTGIPVGSAKVSVTSTDPRKTQTRARKKGEVPAKRMEATGWFALPSIYADPATSPLQADVKSGTNHWDINMR